MEKDPVFERNWQLAVRIVLLIFIIVFALFVLSKLTWVISLLVIAVLIVYTLAPLTSFLTGRAFRHCRRSTGFAFFGGLSFPLPAYSALIEG